VTKNRRPTTLAHNVWLCYGWWQSNVYNRRNTSDNHQPNATKWHLGPAVAEVEKAVIRWTNELLELPIEGGGVLVSGGSAANLTGLTVARNLFFEQMDIRKKGLFGIKPFTIYASNEVHSCIDKSAELLGIGSNQVRKIKTNPDFTINLEAA
jgi:Glutamate decarboxylase and related PLP-dependent proteins